LKFIFLSSQILFTKLSPEMLCGEVQRVEVTLKNIGNAPLTNIHIASTDAKLFTLGNTKIDKLTNEGKHFKTYICHFVSVSSFIFLSYKISIIIVYCGLYQI